MTSGFSPSLPWFFFRDSARAKKPRQGGLEVMRRESEGGEEIIGPLLSPRPVYFFGDFSNCAFGIIINDTTCLLFSIINFPHSYALLLSRHSTTWLHIIFLFTSKNITLYSSMFQIIFGYKHQSHLNESVHDKKY